MSTTANYDCSCEDFKQTGRCLCPPLPNAWSEAQVMAYRKLYELRRQADEAKDMRESLAILEKMQNI